MCTCNAWLASLGGACHLVLAKCQTAARQVAKGISMGLGHTQTVLPLPVHMQSTHFAHDKLYLGATLDTLKSKTAIMHLYKQHTVVSNYFKAWDIIVNYLRHANYKCPHFFGGRKTP